MLRASEVTTFEVQGERFVRPDFNGRGLANLAPTVLELLAPSADRGLPAFDDEVLPQRLRAGIKHVVVVIADGLGHHQLQREMQQGNAPRLAALSHGSESSYQAITSVFPTTTVSALGAVNSGVAPADHGLLSYTIYVPELEMVAEMIRWGPINRRVSFTDAEFGQSAEEFFWAETIYSRLQRAGVQRAFAVNPNNFAGTALTRMLHQHATYAGYVATSSISAIVPRLLAADGEATYVYAYWSTVDTISHIVGPRTEEHGAEVAAFDTAFGRLIDRLPHRDDTLVMLSADHGHVATSPDEQVWLDEHGELLEMLRQPVAGERRAVYLYTRDHDGVVQYARERLHDVATVMSRDEAIQQGIFGPGPIAERARARIGDVLLFPRSNLQLAATILAPDGTKMNAPQFRGLHGGLTEDEALVPLLAVRV